MTGQPKTDTENLRPQDDAPRVAGRRRNDRPDAPECANARERANFATSAIRATRPVGAKMSKWLTVLMIAQLAFFGGKTQASSDEAAFLALAEHGTVQIEGFSLSASASRLQDGILLRDLAITGSGGDGVLRASAVRSRRVSDVVAVINMLRANACLGLPERQVEDLHVEELSLLADPDALPENLGRERVDIQSLKGSLLQMGCEHSAHFALSGVSIASSVQDTLLINEMTLDSVRSDVDGRTISIDVNGSGVKLWNRFSDPGFRLSRFSARFAGNLDMIDEVRGPQHANAENLLTFAAQQNLELSLELGELDIDVRSFLPQTTILDAGLGHLKEITGDLKVALSLDEGKVISVIDLAFPNIVDALLDIVAEVSDGSSYPEFIRNMLPLPDVFLGVSLARFQLEYQDFGLARILDAAGKPAPETLVRSVIEPVVSEVVNPLPMGLKTSVLQASDFLARLVVHGGWVLIEPEAPVRATVLAAAGMAGPDHLASALGLSAKILEE